MIMFDSKLNFCKKDSDSRCCIIPVLSQFKYPHIIFKVHKESRLVTTILCLFNYTGKLPKIAI